MQIVCLSGQHSKEQPCQQRLPPSSSLLCTEAIRPGALRPVEQGCGCSAVRGRCELCACLASTRRSNLANKGCHLVPLCFARKPSREHLAQSSKLVAARCGARQLRTVCLSGVGHMAIEFTVSWLHNSYAVYLAASRRRGQPGAVTGHRSYTHRSDRPLDTSTLAGVILTGAAFLYQGQKRLM